MFQYFNPNPTDRGPKTKWHKNDCAVRAFCGALNRSWGLVYRDLCDIGLKKSDMPNADPVTEAYAKQNGLVKVSLPKYTPLKRFVKENSGTYICRIYGHLVCVKNHTIYDTWDCSEYKVKTFYKKD